MDLVGRQSESRTQRGGARAVARVLVLSLATLGLGGCLRMHGEQAGVTGSATILWTGTRQTGDLQAERKQLTLPPELRALSDTAQPQNRAQTAGAPMPANGLSALTMTGSIGSVSSSAAPEGPARIQPATRSFRLADAVASAIFTYPEIRAFEARMREADAGINVARAGFWPNGDLRLAAGGNFGGSYEGQTIPYRTGSNTLDKRLDGSLMLRQLVFDFGATSSDVRRAKHLRDSEALRLRDKVEDVAGKTVQAYLRVLEQRALVSLVDEVITAHQQLGQLIQAQSREGHGTVADVERVNARIVDVRAIRSDVTLQLKAAEDQFERMTRHRPGSLAPPADMVAKAPRNAQAAIQEALSNNPRLAAITSNTRASQAELDFQRASALPRFNLEIEGDAKNFRNGPSGRTQADARSMLAMRYRFMDGGLSQATREQILERINAGEFMMLNEREQLEQDIRQAYRAIDSSRNKLRLVAAGVASAKRVRELYLEQFKGGKRTVFELLDSQMSLFTIRRNQIESQFEGRRAVFEILRATGQLTKTLANGA